MEKIRVYLQNHPRLNKAIFFVSLVSIGCFSFPIESPFSQLNFWKAYSVIVGYFFVAVVFKTIYGKNRKGLVYIISLILTSFGMVSRYFLEYGEVSNIRDFTIFNIVSFLLVIPLYILIAYKFIAKSYYKSRD